MAKSLKKVLSLFLVVIMCFSSLSAASFANAASDHQHVLGEWYVSKKPTCEVSGAYMRECELCNYYEEAPISPIKHKWNNGEVLEKSTCAVQGTYVYTCLNDSTHTYSVLLPLDEDAHIEETYTLNEVAASCEKEGYSGDVYCKGCDKKLSSGEKVSAIGKHVMDDWQVVTKPTLFSEGVQVRYCKRCSASETENIAKLQMVTAYDFASDITVDYAKEYFDGNEIELQVNNVYMGNHELRNLYSRITAWEIKATANSEIKQPANDIKLHLPVPAEYSEDKLEIYYINTASGAYKKIIPENVENGYITLMISSFGIYAVVDTDSFNEYHDCECGCHARGLPNIIFKIFLYIQKIFGINDECACGVVHYKKINFQLGFPGLI